METSFITAPKCRSVSCWSSVLRHSPTMLVREGYGRTCPRWGEPVGFLRTRCRQPACSLATVRGGRARWCLLFLGARLGRMLPIMFSLLASTGCLLALLFFSNKLVYALVIQLYMFVWLMFFPYLMGIVSELDPVGRLAGVSYALQSIGFAIGPALAALMIPGGGYASLFYLGIGCYLATLLLLLSLARKPGADAG